ncbi:MAG TPA: hypothetical protein VL285_26910 [Bryobacteraceae bacterium]|nr:hypothetical protein [Bryobacteraceae bacterium]
MSEESNPRVLAESMRSRRAKVDPDPYILLLGQACARAAGATVEAVARQVLRSVESQDLPVSPDEPDPGKLLAGFRQFLSSQDESTREYLLRSDGGLAIPVFYQDLASLIKTGYFRQILTTGIDRMLETSLTRKGWEEGSQYHVIRLSPSQPASKPDPDAEAPVTIVKLHGDLANPELIGSPDMIDVALRYNRSFVKSGLAGDIVCVGYEFECEPLMDWLRRSQGSELWFAHEKPPSLEPLRPFETLRKVRTMVGPDAEPGLFFAHLFDALLDNPRSTGLPLDVLRSRALAGQSKRGSEVLQRLERTAADAPDNTGIAAQIVKQRVDVGALNSALYQPQGALEASVDIDKYLGNRGGASDALGILSGLRQNVRKSGVDPDTAKLFDDLIDNVTRQIHSGKNPKIVHRLFDTLNALGDASEELSPDTKNMLRSLSGLRGIL